MAHPLNNTSNSHNNSASHSKRSSIDQRYYQYYQQHYPQHNSSPTGSAHNNHNQNNNNNNNNHIDATYEIIAGQTSTMGICINDLLDDFYVLRHTLQQIQDNLSYNAFLLDQYPRPTDNHTLPTIQFFNDRIVNKMSMVKSMEAELLDQFLGIRQTLTEINDRLTPRSPTRSIPYSPRTYPHQQSHPHPPPPPNANNNTHNMH